MASVRKWAFVAAFLGVAVFTAEKFITHSATSKSKDREIEELREANLGMLQLLQDTKEEVQKVTQKRNRNVEAEFERCDRETQQLQGQLAKAKSQLRLSRLSNRTLRATVRKQQAQLRCYKKQVHHVHLSHQKTKPLLSQKDKELQQSRREVQSLKTAISMQEAETNRQSWTVLDTSTRLQVLKSKVQASVEVFECVDLDGLRRKTEGMNNLIERQQREITTLRRHIEAKDNDSRRLRMQLDASEAQARAAHSKNDTIAVLKLNLEASRAKSSSLKDTVAECTKKLEESKADFRRSNDFLAQMQVEAKNHVARTTSLEATLSHQTTFITRLTNPLEYQVAVMELQKYHPICPGHLHPYHPIQIQGQTYEILISCEGMNALSQLIDTVESQHEFLCKENGELKTKLSLAEADIAMKVERSAALSLRAALSSNTESTERSTSPSWSTPPSLSWGFSTSDSQHSSSRDTVSTNRWKPISLVQLGLASASQHDNRRSSSLSSNPVCSSVEVDPAILTIPRPSSAVKRSDTPLDNDRDTSHEIMEVAGFEQRITNWLRRSTHNAQAAPKNTGFEDQIRRLLKEPC